jgi:signal transduction histidine kinase
MSAAADDTIRRHQKSVDVMDGQCALMAELIDNLTLLDRWEQEIQHVVPGPIDIVSLLSDMVTMFCETYPQRSFILDNGVGDQARVLIDPQEFTFMLSNVIDNALKYTAGLVTIVLLTDDATLLIKVQDQGPGMPDSIKARVFDRFFRGTRRDVDGSGLGLPIARAAAERAQGSIVLESSASAGTTAVIRLPYVLG